MRICFFTDIHGNGAAFRAFRECMEVEQPDKIIFGGDFCGYYYDAIEIMRQVQELGYICIRGNHDQMFLDCKENPNVSCQISQLADLIRRYGNGYRRLFNQISENELEFLRSLPLKAELEADGLQIGFFHGSPRDLLSDRIYPDLVIEDVTAFSGYDYMFLGHTHHKLVKRIGGSWIINPGSAGQQRDGKGTSYIIFDTRKRLFKIVSFSYDRDIVARQIDLYEAGNPEMKHKLKEVLYRKQRY